MDVNSYLSNGDPDAFESLYDQFRKDPNSVDRDWRRFFQGFDFSISASGKREQLSKAQQKEGPQATDSRKEIAVSNLIGAYRQRGHLFARTNPVRPRRKHEMPIVLEDFGLGKEDMESVFKSGERIGLESAPLKDILAALEQTYCSSVGIEYKFVRTPEVLHWLEKRMESCRNSPETPLEEQLHHLKKINEAVHFENFLHRRFVGQKRFSLEGSEAIIPALDTIVEKGVLLGVKEYVIGMAHRGRLNVLTSILGKTYEDVFMEFDGKLAGDEDFEGDVKYHMGHSCDRLVRTG